MPYDASRHLTMTPAENGGVRLRLRFRDQPASFLPKSELVDEEGYEGPLAISSDEDNPTEQIIYVFGPLVEGQSCKLEEQDSGTIAVVVVSPPDEIIGNTINSGGTTSGKIDTGLNVQGPTTDARSRYIAASYGKNSDSSKLAGVNANNKKFWGR